LLLLLAAGKPAEQRAKQIPARRLGLLLLLLAAGKPAEQRTKQAFLCRSAGCLGRFLDSHHRID
jgi:hypothetical protein